ncbi:MAG: shikimate kinase [Bacteroidota bacterium]|jgi:shikimate kinase
MVIFLIGLPCSGKSTLGKNLSEKLNYAFIDLDTEVCKYANKSILEIINEGGEESFRNYEKTCLQNLNLEKDVIVSTGGGTPCFYDNIEWMNKNGITVFLNPELSEILLRLQSSNSERPLLNNSLEYLTQIKNERDVYYKQAKVEISSTENIEKIISKIFN